MPFLGRTGDSVYLTQELFLNRQKSSSHFGRKRALLTQEKVEITQERRPHWELGDECVDKVKGEMRLLVKSLGPEGILLAEDVPRGRNVAFFSAKPRDLGFNNLAVRPKIGAQR